MAQLWTYILLWCKVNQKGNCYIGIIRSLHYIGCIDHFGSFCSESTIDIPSINQSNNNHMFALHHCGRSSSGWYFFLEYKLRYWSNNSKFNKNAGICRFSLKKKPSLKDGSQTSFVECISSPNSVSKHLKTQHGWKLSTRLIKGKFCFCCHLGWINPGCQKNVNPGFKSASGQWISNPALNW